jgi:hypothetical protein
MFLLLGLGGLTPFCPAWKNSGTPAGRSWWVLGRSGLRTSETESGWWPTIHGSGNVDKTGKRGGACELAMAAKYPERMKGGHVRLKYRPKGAKQSPGEVRPSTEPGGQQGQESDSTSGKTLGCLSPEWVAQLMGLPEGWLDIEPIN